MKKLFIAMMACAALTCALPTGAQVINKYSASTQMFLAEQAGRISLTPTQEEIEQRAKSRGISVAEAAREASQERPIAEAVTKDGRQYVPAFVRVTDRSAVARLEALGVKIQCEFSNGTLYTTEIPVNQIEAVARISQVSQISVATKMRPFTNAARQRTNVDDVLAFTADARAAGLPNAYDGSGVIMGVIDTGIDFQHIAFKDKNGNSRIKRAYVYNGTTDKEYTSITSSAPTTDNSNQDHGTHTSSTAGGSSVVISGTSVTVTDDHASASFGGMAPGADLYLAGINGLSSTYMANAFQKICNYADQQGKPVVVSNSWGSQWGPHDGTGEFAEICAQYFGDNHPNHICLFAASNDAGGGGFHISGTATSSQPLGARLVCNTTVSAGPVTIAWPRSNVTNLTCKILVYNSSGLSSTISVNPTASGSYINGSGYWSGSLYALSQQSNGKNSIVLYGQNFKTNSSSYIGVIFYPTNGSTVVDAWTGTDYAQYTTTPALSGYTWTMGTDDNCVSDEATIPDAISIGAYVSKNSVTDYNNSNHSLSSSFPNVGDITYFSSYATADQTPTGEQYPWICAPGATLVAGVNHYSSAYINGSYDRYGMYRVNNTTTNPYGNMNGTSMATPTAAGIVALWLQAAQSVGKELTVNDVKEIMRQTAINDTYTTTGSNRTHFGNGKIDALAGIEYILGNATDPVILASSKTVNFQPTNTGESATQTVTITGRNLTGDIRATLTDPNGAFSLSATTITATEAEQGKEITVTFAPKTATACSGSITLTSAGASDVTVTLSGTGQLLKLVPTMATADDNAVTHTSFRADWSDETPAANVSSYTLHVSAKSFIPPVTLLDTTDWTSSNTVPTGWTQVGMRYYSSSSACYLSTTGYVQSRTYDLTGYDKVTVQVYAQPYNSGNTITVATGADSKTSTIPSGNSFAWYTFVLNCASNDYVKLTSSGMPDLRYMRVYAGDATAQQNAPARVISEEGDSTTRIITGITDKAYTVKDLTGGGTFYYRVKAVYADNTESDWSNTEQVTLKATPDTGLPGDVNLDGVVDVSDVNILISIILGTDKAENYGRRAYINDDDKVDVSDVNILISIILGSN